MSFPVEEDKITLRGYVVNMSPIKLSRKNKPYFNLHIEDEQKVHQAVCFSPSKKRLFDDVLRKGKGVTICNAHLGVDGSTILINDSTKIKEEQLGFQPNLDIETKLVKEIVNEVPVKNKVNVVGHVLLDEVTKVSVKGQDVPIRNGYICDGTGFSKLPLW